ncbi:aspartate/glutamate racemase family protein [Catenulispora rubra]|uniref:aspartate/glutamate racemase family protein n=1 Tax=Catenulispora rubra TaxID=280293 RepID=UPI0018921B5D|nr:amino acid racemase [Catenulispora rubra]
MQNRDHRHLGILAHSAEGAALSFQTFCREGFARLGPHAHPDVTLDLIPLSRSMPHWESGDYHAVRAILRESADRLAAAGADFFICPDNTAHLAFELDGDPYPIPGLHIAEVVADEAAARGHRKIGILGTRFTMEGPVYPRALAARGIDSAAPDAADRATVDTIIFDELVNGVFTDAGRAAYRRVIEHLAAAGCDAVALVCTEIPLLVTPGTSPLPTLDSTRLQARAAFEVAINARALPTWRGGPPVTPPPPAPAPAPALQN